MENPKIILGVCGSIAAYKALELTRLLQAENIDVTVIQTHTSQKFIGIASFAALSGNAVLQGDADFAFPHLDVARDAQMLVIAPATATTMARLAHGMADEILSATALGFEGIRIIAPAMNVKMWNNPATQRNLKTLTDDGWHVISPEDGQLACGDVGKGRLAHVEVIFDQILAALKEQ